MCNAKNHSPNCTCGFGEVGGIKFRFKAQRSFDFNTVEKIPYSNVVSHTPNATCPECSEPVFFYKNEHGSAVFFDKLGPPWPKHPCTDNSTFIPFTGKPKKSTAEVKGWFPVELIIASKIKDNMYEFQFNLRDNGKLTLFLSSIEIEQRANFKILSDEAICYLKKETNEVYSLSLLSDDFKVLNSKGFVNKNDCSK